MIVVAEGRQMCTETHLELQHSALMKHPWLTALHHESSMMISIIDMNINNNNSSSIIAIIITAPRILDAPVYAIRCATVMCV